MLVPDQPAPEIVWGIVSRGVGLVFLIAFLSLRPQVLVIAGRTGILPVAEALRAQARDFPTWRRFFYFPTLLWLSSSDWAQFTDHEHVLDIPERYPRFEFTPDAEVVLTADQRSPTG